MNDLSPTIARTEVEELHVKFREIKHSINNTFAVIMALSELGQRNPEHLVKLANAVLTRSPVVVDQLSNFSDMLGAVIKGEKMPPMVAEPDKTAAAE